MSPYGLSRGRGWPAEFVVMVVTVGGEGSADTASFNALARFSASSG
jgi:hypothetical protein